MALSFSELFAPPSFEAIRAAGLRVFRALGFPVDTWGPTNQARAFLEVEARALADLALLIVAIAKMGLLTKASGAALRLHAEEFFDERPRPSSLARGTATLTETAGSAQTFAPGALVWVSDDDAVVFRNASDIRLPARASVDVVLVASAPGAAFNVASDRLRLVTPPPGVRVFLAAARAWLTVVGADEEDDESLRARCIAKWGTLTQAGPDAAYRKWSLDASAEINRVAILERPEDLPPKPALLVVLASPIGRVPPLALEAARAFVARKRPLGLLVQLESAQGVPLRLRGTVTVRSAFRASAEASALRALDAYVRTLPIGAPLAVAQVLELLMAPEGVVNARLVDDAGRTLVPWDDDWSVPEDGVLELVTALDFSEV